MRKLNSRYFLISFFAIALMGCTTTGDPKKGGLFGWSEAKAKERQAQLNRDIEAAKKEQDLEKQRSAHFSNEKRAIEQSNNQLESRLALLVSENIKLQSQLDTLREKKVVSSDSIKSLSKRIDALKLPKNLSTQFNELSSVQEKVNYLDQLEAANEAYTELIIHIIEY